MKEKILIIGIDGFIGGHIYDYFYKKNDYFITGTSKKDLNLLEFYNLETVLKKNKFDYVINCVVQGGRRNNVDCLQSFSDNISMFNNLLKLKQLYKNLIFFGSGAEYNRKNNIFNVEESIFDSIPTDFYGHSKFINTAMARNLNFGLNLRLFNCFSDIGQKDSFIHTAIDSYINNANIEIFNDKYFDFFYIDDLIKVIEYFINSNYNRYYYELNCAYGYKVKLSEVANLINNLSHKKVDILVKNDNFDSNYCASGDKLKELNIEFNGLLNGIKTVYDKKNYSIDNL